ncbi:DUF4376 domain-containing protein [Acinetobacter seifertii]|uniref:DUF4376 domain-containing protein n=1 Tax=Acinetobacter seifertii TaxID=1530123 RepID=UPI0018DE8CA8|nr:DUF4376 domain-containing protein [Acinetobacter seifertii]QPV60365.1 DUF4376 domain-containing protein [Acinetobacter seifertii]
MISTENANFIVNGHGQLITQLSGGAEFISAHLSEGQFLTTKPKPDALSYWDFKLEDWLLAPQRPDAYSNFDFISKRWIDSRSLEEVKAQKWNEIKQMRDIREFGGFEYGGNWFDSDIKSQSRIATAAMLGVNVEWTLKDNSTINLNPDQLIELRTALANHINNTHELGRIARAKIAEASTKEEVDTVALV